MKAIAILGAGGHGKVVADLASLNGFTRIDFFDDKTKRGTMIGPWSVVGTVDDAFSQQSTYHSLIVGVGDNKTRAKLLERIPTQQRITLIHPTAVVSQYARVGEGVVVLAGAIVNTFASVGNGVIINSGAL